MNTTATAPERSASLVLADPTGFKDLLARALEPDFTCVRPASQTQLVAVVDRLRPDPALLSVWVGEADGVGAGQKLSQVHRKVRVVVLSAHGDPAPKQQTEDAITWR